MESVDKDLIIAKLKLFLFDERDLPIKADSALNGALFEIIKTLGDDQIIQLIKDKCTGCEAIQEYLYYYRFGEPDENMNRIARLWDEYYLND